MKKLISSILISILVNCTVSYLWLFTANSSAPSPGKEIISGLYILAITILFWSFKSIKELLIFALIGGLLAGISGLLTAMVYFPAAFHEIDLRYQGLGILLTGGAIFIVLYLLYGLLILSIKKHTNKSSQ